MNPDKFGYRGRGCLQNPDVHVSKYWNEMFQVSVCIDFIVKYSDSQKGKVSFRPTPHNFEGGLQLASIGEEPIKQRKICTGLLQPNGNITSETRRLRAGGFAV